MSNTGFEVDKDLNISGRGSLTNAMRLLPDTTLATCIQEGARVFKEICTVYMKAIANDGKIIGSERGDILEEVDRFFDILILAWKSLEPRRAQEEILIENKQHGFRLFIEEKNGIWNANGRITPLMVTPVKNFRTLYSDKLAPEIVTLLTDYRAAVADKVIDAAEKETLRKGIRQVLYYTLFLRLQLERCLVSD